MPETAELFDKVAKHYDALNTLFSLGIDRLWRKRLVEQIEGSRRSLDIATGTAEVAIETARKFNDCRVTGLDPSMGMLTLARRKISTPSESLSISLVQGAAEYLPFRDDAFDSATIAFGIRNTMDPIKSLQEMRRVISPEGKIAILEFAIPKNRFISPIYLFYFQNVLPLVGSVFNTGKEYKYLSDSTSSFPQRESFVELMKKAGIRYEKSIELTFGIAVIYVGTKV